MAMEIMTRPADALSEALGINNEITVIEAIVEVESETEELIVEEVMGEEATSDYQLARSTYRSLINKGNDALDNIAKLAEMSDSPRAYEVLATIMGTIVTTTKELFELQKKKKDFTESKKPERARDQERINVEKAVFVGSSADLLKQVKPRSG